MGLAPGRAETSLELMNRLLDRGYTEAAGPTIQAITRNGTSGIMATRLRELDAEAARLAKEGLRMTAQNPVARALIADFEDVMKQNAALVNGAAPGVEATGIQAAGPVARQMALPGVSDQALQTMGIRWNVPNPDAVAQIVNYSGSDAWAEGLVKYGDNAVELVRDTALRGSLMGWGPARTAREMRALVEGVPPNVANTMMRTLQLTSLRDAQVVHRVANEEILQEQIRIAALDDATCIACVALHGTRLPIEARIDDHYNGRCTSITVLKGRPAPNVQSGEAWFAQRSEAQQRAQMGDAAFEAWKAGRVQLGDFVQKTTDDVFGGMVQQASLSGMLGKAEARTFYRGGSAVTERAPVSLGEQARQQLRAIATETDERVKQIVAEREALHEANMRVWDYMDTDQFRALSREEKDAIWDKLEIDTQKIGTLYEAERQELLKVTERIRNEVLYVDNPAQFQAKLTAGAKGRAGIPDGVADFRRMVSADVIPEGSSVNVQLTRRVRSYASGDVIYMDKSAGARTTVHELGHWLETVNPDVHQAAIDFLDKRTKGDDLQNLTELRPGLGYRPDEKARPDAFFDPYVGKDYGGRASEVVSMGMEYMYAEPVRFMTEDPEHFDLVYGLLRGKR